MNLDVFLKNIKNSQDNDLIKSNFPLIQKEINQLIFAIQKHTDIVAAKNCFDQLQKIQHVVAKLIFSKNIKVTCSLWKFFKDFDRIDDDEVRFFLFNQMKNNKYVL